MERAAVPADAAAAVRDHDGEPGDGVVCDVSVPADWRGAIVFFSFLFLFFSTGLRLIYYRCAKGRRSDGREFRQAGNTLRILFTFSFSMFF